MNNLPDDAAMMTGLCQGDRASFVLLYEQHAGELYRYIYLFIRSREDAEDILQNVFTRIWMKRETLGEVRSMRSFLFRVTRNQVLNYFRSAKVKMRVQKLMATEDAAENADAGELLQYKQYYELAKDAINKLPKRRQEVFRLSHEGGLNTHEIADQLHISSSAVKQHLYAASDFIRDYLQKHGDITASLLIFLTLFDNCC
ncbi:RNA polymerase sigma-70 factor [Chitinophaga varians]|uniref:RNA polymerase sigma-70 factor n=1 Tax=Chitinophaga varians TaxID=2202339 RepID=A0A847RZW9_9BACT|nr:RNA polymerase sigma-70 factor [Chitinophaga varians]NLR66418.1 RNA polymerase sigma-70 factor [Chitinophaga varians]